MNLTFNWINLLILFGALQALIFCIILLFQKNHPGVRYFAAFIFVLAYNGFETINWSAGLDRYYIFFDLFGFIVIYGVGPSLYLYVTSLINPGVRFSVREVAAHYGLVIFQFVTRIAIVTYHILWINKIIESQITSMELLNIVWTYAEPLSVVIFTAYLSASIYQFRKVVREKNITKDRIVVFSWIRVLLIFMVIIAIAWAITILAPDFLKVPFGPHYYPIELMLVLFNYWVVFYGFLKVKEISFKSTRTVPATVIDDSGKVFEQLKRAMEIEKLFLDPEMNLSKLSSHTKIPSKSISFVLNQYQQTGFNDFINTYRVEEVKERMLAEEYQHLTISGIALESGFNSQATFQRAFKSYTGMSPREFVNHSKKKV